GLCLAYRHNVLSSRRLCERGGANTLRVGESIMDSLEPLSPMNPYFMPITMGFLATTTQNVFQAVQTTAGQMVVPLRIVDLQRDLDRDPEGPKQVPLRLLMRALANPQLAAE